MGTKTWTPVLARMNADVAISKDNWICVHWALRIRRGSWVWSKHFTCKRSSVGSISVGLISLGIYSLSAARKQIRTSKVFMSLCFVTGWKHSEHRQWSRK